MYMAWAWLWSGMGCFEVISGLILSLRPANERWCYFVTMFLIGWVQTWNQSCISWSRHVNNPVLQTSSECDVNGVHGRSSLGWPQLDLTPHHLTHLFVQQLTCSTSSICSFIMRWLRITWELRIKSILIYISMAQSQPAMFPLLMHWRYCSLALSHQYGKSTWDPGLLSRLSLDLSSYLHWWPVIHGVAARGPFY